MKHLLIIIITIFCLNSYEAISSCPFGYSSEIDTIDINGCDFEIQWCYRCDPTGAVTGWIDIGGYTKLNKNCTMSPSLTDQEISDYIWDNFLDFEMYAELCSIQPCGVDTTRYNVTYPICWIKQLNGLKIEYKPCPEGENYCNVEFFICFNGFTYIEVDRDVTINQGADPETYCPDEWVPDPTDMDPITDCFHIYSNCYVYQ